MEATEDDRVHNGDVIGADVADLGLVTLLALGQQQQAQLDRTAVAGRVQHIAQFDDADGQLAGRCVVRQRQVDADAAAARQGS